MEEIEFGLLENMEKFIIPEEAGFGFWGSSRARKIGPNIAETLNKQIRLIDIPSGMLVMREKKEGK